MSALPEQSDEAQLDVSSPDDFDLILPDPPAPALNGDAVFDQAGIDALFDFDQAPVATTRSGLKAIIDSDAINQEQLPMLEVVCDRMVRTFSAPWPSRRSRPHTHGQGGLAMTFATFTNLVLMVLCGAVLVQSLRMTRALNLIRNSDLKEMIESLCKASAEAQTVLTRLKGVLDNRRLRRQL